MYSSYCAALPVKEKVMADTLNLSIFTGYCVRLTGKIFLFFLLFRLYRLRLFCERPFSLPDETAGGGSVYDRIHLHRFRSRRIHLHRLPVYRHIGKCLREPMEDRILPEYREVSVRIGPDRTKPVGIVGVRRHLIYMKRKYFDYITIGHLTKFLKNFYNTKNFSKCQSHRNL
jgi:hypothetical protein